MTRSRSYRRAQATKAKRKARNVYVRIWRVKARILPSPGSRYTVPGPLDEPDLAWVGKQAAVHSRGCSCFGCKRYNGDPAHRGWSAGKIRDEEDSSVYNLHPTQPTIQDTMFYDDSSSLIVVKRSC